ncbi:MAG: ParB/RepB/Spo0J family partition protein [Actinobacteria bacterium]|nr:ParB/RepB/Spo0J family partition protein [Actinomycetota bacterium]
MVTKRGGLGRNLDSLIPTPIRAPGIAQPVAGKLEVSIESVKPNRRQPRSIFDDEALQELAASIREIGILQPPVVRRSGDNQYELIIGERRLRAAKLAGLSTIPVIIRETSDNELLREALIENIHRSNLNSLEEAAAYNQMLSDFGLTHDELAKKIGKSRPVISNTLRFLNLPPSVQNKLTRGTLSMGHARALLGISDSSEIERIANRIVAEGLSVRATEELIAVGSGKKSSGKKGNTSSLGKYQELEEQIGDALDTRVRIKGGANGGRIQIEFADSQDLLRIAKKLS